MSNIRTININLSVNGLSKGTKELQSIADCLPKIRKEFKRRSLNFIEERAKAYIRSSTGGSSWYELTQTLENSFIKDVQLGTLINNCAYAAFVEFGTGIVGNGTHPMPDGYQYDVSNHGDDGWWFFDEHGTIHFTKGLEAHHFMYDAVNDYIKGEYKSIFNTAAKEIIGGAK